MTDYRVTFRPKPSTIPPIIRLRRLLKLALRYLNMTAVSVEEIPHQPNAEGRNGADPYAGSPDNQKRERIVPTGVAGESSKSDRNEVRS